MLERPAVAVVVAPRVPAAKMLLPIPPAAAAATPAPVPVVVAAEHELVAVAAAAHAGLAEGDLAAVRVEEAEAHAVGEVVAGWVGLCGVLSGGVYMHACVHVSPACSIAHRSVS